MKTRRACCLLPSLFLACLPLRAQVPATPDGPASATAAPADARYQIVQAPTDAKRTFRLDRVTGQVASLARTREGNYTWQNNTMTGLPDIRTSTRPRFQLIVTDAPTRQAFLLDTDTGNTWTVTVLLDEIGKETGYGWKPFSR